MFWLDTQLNLLGFFQPKDGDIGLEFEVETLHEIESFNTFHWGCKPENSLRNGAEWVLLRPAPITKIPDVITEWFYYSKEEGIKPVNNSLRTSIHVHINIGSYTLRQIYTILTAYYLLEDILIHYAGPTRKGNLFCLGISAADNPIKLLVDNLINQRHFLHFDKDTYKYAALNLPAILSFGSLEFRMMRGDYSNPNMIIEWVQQLHQMCKCAAAMKDPKDVLFRYKGSSPFQFLNLFFSEPFAHKLIETCPNFNKLLRNNFHYSFALASGIPSWDTPKDYKDTSKKAKIDELELISKKLLTPKISTTIPGMVDSWGNSINHTSILKKPHWSTIDEIIEHDYIPPSDIDPGNY